KVAKAASTIVMKTKMHKFSVLVAASLLVVKAGAFQNPEVGDFAERDNRRGPNLYAFVDNDPVNFVDPFGLDKLSLTYDFLNPNDLSFFEKLSQPGGTKYVKTTQELLDDLKQKL